jgi:hypothetical protein
MRKNQKELFGFMMTRLKKRWDLCLCPGDSCEEKAINAHSIQNRRTLDLLSVNGHIIMPKPKLTATALPTFIFKSLSQNKATSFTGLCKNHDTELFKPIDTNQLDINDPEHLFLVAYRSVLREAFVSMKSAIDTQLTYQKGAAILNLASYPVIGILSCSNIKPIRCSQLIEPFHLQPV